MRTKNAAIPLIIVVVLSTLGVTYASWKDLVVIEGAAKMGTVTLAFDYDEPPLPTEFYRYGPTGNLTKGEYLDKDVANSSAWYDGYCYDEHTEKEGWKVLFIRIDNAYPCYYLYTTFKLHNIGSIPLVVYGYEITGGKYDKNGTLVYDLLAKKTAAEEYLLYEDMNDNGVVDEGDVAVIWLGASDIGEHKQIKPCTTDKREVDLHFLQEAQQCHSYLLEIRIKAIQWNKLYETVT